MARQIAVSLAAFDGYAPEVALDSIAACDARCVELAYIVGYTEIFDQSSFTHAEARRWSSLLAERKLTCNAVSAHIDLGLEDAVEVFRPRMDFARSLGASVINTNAAHRSRGAQFYRNIEMLARHGEAIGLVIGLENPGNGEDNLFNLAADGAALLRSLNLPSLGLNFDAANLASHRPDADVTQETLASLPYCIHYHLKDVARRPDGWHFTPLGTGDIDHAAILPALARLPDLPVSLELPLRLRRGSNARPIRAPEALPLAEIEAAVTASLAYARRFLAET